MVSTDALYFAVGKFGVRRRRNDHGFSQPGRIQRDEVHRDRRRRRSRSIPAWHNPGPNPLRRPAAARATPAARSRSENVLDDFARHCLSFVDARRSSRSRSPWMPGTVWRVKRSRTFSRISRAKWCRSTSSSTAAFRTILRAQSKPRTWSTCRQRFASTVRSRRRLRR